MRFILCFVLHITYAAAVQREIIGLSVFDNPEILKSTFCKELVSYHNLKQYNDWKHMDTVKLQSVTKSLSKVYENNTIKCTSSFCKIVIRYRIFSRFFLVTKYSSVINSLFLLVINKSPVNITDLMRLNFHTIDTNKVVFNGAILGILLLQEVYKLDIEMFRNNYSTH